MRFYTGAVYDHWYEHYDNKAIRTVHDRYTRHLQEMVGVLPDRVLALAELDGVGDGLIVSVQHDRDHQILVLTMRCGDLTKGYYDLELTYEGATLLSEHERILAYIARHQTLDLDGRYETAGELAYHEVDRADNGKIEHRLLFHPGRWFSIQCDALFWRQIPRPNRDLPPLRDRYPDGPPDTQTPPEFQEP